MSSIIRKTNHRKLLETIYDLIREAKEEEYPLENADGKKQNFRIHCMSIAIISCIEKSHVFINHALNRKETETSTTALIDIWIKNKHKMVQSQIAIKNVTVDPENFTIFFKQNINKWIHDAVHEFLRTEKKDTKSSYKSSDPPEIHMEPIKIKRNLVQSVVEAAKNVTRQLHEETASIRNVETKLTQNAKIFLLADSEGRKILTKNNDYFCIVITATFINKQRYEIEKTLADYGLTEQEMKKKIRDLKKDMKQTVKEYEQLEFLKPGFYPMLLQPDTSEVFFHECIAGHLLSGQYIAEEETNIFQEIGKNWIVDPRFEILKQIKIENKPTMENTIATYKYDHEGIRAKDIVLIDKGSIINHLTNRNSAFRLKQKESNGTALAETFVDEENEVRNPEPRISNMIITSYSRKSEASLRKEIVRYCKRLNLDFYLEISAPEGEVDMENGNFIMKISECDMVFLDGTKKKVWGGVLSGDMFSFISMIKGISKETETIQGICGASSGNVPAYSEAPYMILEMFQFKPTKKPEKIDVYLNPKHVPPKPRKNARKNA